MKISFWIHEKYEEPEIVICSAQKTKELEELRQTISDAVDEKITVFDERDAVRITLSEIIRFYTGKQRVYAQTKDKTYLVHARLYELEESLKKQFVRISNSEIVNVKKYAGWIRVFRERFICTCMRILRRMYPDVMSAGSGTA